MTATTMHFGPEWMRNRASSQSHTHAPSRPQPASSPPPASASATTASLAPPGASSYSSLVMPTPPPSQEKRDAAHPFKYSKEELLQIWKDGGGRGGLGLEVERWEGVVREVGDEPMGVKEMSEAEKKLFTVPLNSELRRRQSSDVLPALSLSSSALNGERPKLQHAGSGTGSPLRERFGSLMSRRREGTGDQPPPTLPRKLSLTSLPGPLSSRDASLPSPRPRIGSGSTQGFDGVLSGGDTWTGKRRAAEALGRSQHRGDLTSADTGHDGKELDIKEEEEDTANSQVKVERAVKHAPSPSPQPSSTNSVSKSSGHDSASLHKSVDQVSLPNDYKKSVTSQNSDVSASNGPSNPLFNGPPPGIVDLAGVEWSYLDPQGHMQGPFRADLMQKWYDEGYFTPDLLMKRTHIDAEWTPVGDLTRRVNGEKIFLSPRNDAAPPLDLPGHANSQRTPYQPVPTRTARSGTLDSYLSATPNASVSSSSSFGGGGFATRTSVSPDPAGFRSTDHGNSRGTGFAAATDPHSQLAGLRRPGYNEMLIEPAFGVHSPSVPILTPGRSSSFDTYGFSGPSGPSSATWRSTDTTLNTAHFDNGLRAQRLADPTGSYTSIGSSNYPRPQDGGYGPPSSFTKAVEFAQMRDSPSSHEGSLNSAGPSSSSFAGSGFGAIGASSGQRDVARFGRQMKDEKQDNIGNSSAGFNSDFSQGIPRYGNVVQGQHFGQSSMQYPIQQQSHSLPPLSSVSGSQHTLNNGPADAVLASSQVRNVHQPITSTPLPPWSRPDPSAPRRQGQLYPTPITTSLPTSGSPPQQSSWGRGPQNSQSVPAPAETAWLRASKGIVDDGWGEVPGPNSLTFSNVGQHNQLHDEGSTIHDSPPVIEAQAVELPPATMQTAEFVSLHIPAQLSPIETAVPKARRKSAVTQPQPPITKPTPSASAAATPYPAVASLGVPAKPAWSNEEDKNKPSGVTLGLREIQEAEAKKLENRKVAEKERERVSRLISQPQPASEDLQLFTASWGLPTSQAGARNMPPAKEATPATTPSVTSPSTGLVWTTGTNPPTSKKSMKEIQEEEEKRKKLAVREKEIASASAKRAYAESATKTTIPAQPSGGAWTTVGASGKSSSPAVVVPPRPTPTTLPSSTSISGSPVTQRPVNGSAPSVRVTAVPPPMTRVPSTATPKVDETPVPPSADFLKWLRDSLRGLNNSVHYDEISSMLLSFPLDPDPSTIELISDLIYANSTTLDGRRFAAEFVAKRKTDAANRPKVAVAGGANTSTSNGKPASIADIVKAQPKTPTQAEWGGFKVVNKKKKGTRA